MNLFLDCFFHPWLGAHNVPKKKSSGEVPLVISRMYALPSAFPLLPRPYATSAAASSGTV